MHCTKISPELEFRGSRQLCLRPHLTDTMFTLCVALEFCHCFSVVRCPWSLFDITPPKSFLFIIIIIHGSTHTKMWRTQQTDVGVAGVGVGHATTSISK